MKPYTASASSPKSLKREVSASHPSEEKRRWFLRFRLRSYFYIFDDVLLTFAEADGQLVKVVGAKVIFHL